MLTICFVKDTRDYVKYKSLIFIKFGVEFLCTFRTDAVTEFCFRVFTDKALDFIPVPLVIFYFFTTRANWKESRQYFDFS